MTTLSSSPFFSKPFINPNPKPPPNLRPPTTITCKSHYETERNLEFETGDTFFRHESATGRDLGVLAAAIHKKTTGKLRILDAMCGCGIRSLRYLAESNADFVLANDGNEDYRSIIKENLSRVVLEEENKWEVTHCVANRVMAERYIERDYFDFIDVDSFGSDSSFLRCAFDAVKLGGLLYVTSTDGYTSGGHRPKHSLDSYGAYIRPMPYSNEIGLRMLIGGAVREASVLGYHVSPLFSYYSYHGPVFRVLLRVNRGKLPHAIIGLSATALRVDILKLFRGENLVPGSLVVSGPLWTGPLHSATYLTEMQNLAEQWGWVGNDMGRDLEKLLQQMIDESDPKLPFGYIHLAEIASRAKLNSPPLRTIMSAMHKEGYAASRSHIASNAIKTNCPMAECIRIMKELQEC